MARSVVESEVVWCLETTFTEEGHKSSPQVSDCFIIVDSLFVVFFSFICLLLYFVFIFLFYFSFFMLFTFTFESLKATAWIRLMLHKLLIIPPAQIVHHVMSLCSFWVRCNSFLKFSINTFFCISPIHRISATYFHSIQASSHCEWMQIKRQFISLYWNLIYIDQRATYNIYPDQFDLWRVFWWKCTEEVYFKFL